MNYLAHSLLSGADDEILVGNFIADSVRGSQLHIFPEKIALGIILHRQIDTFTDSHPVVHQSKDRLRAGYKKYAGVIADIYYDHFLAVNFAHYSEENLAAFAQRVYDQVNQYESILPEKVKFFLPYMIKQNWLVNYAHLDGIRRSLTGLSRRTSFVSNMETAADELQQNYDLYYREFEIFFPELYAFVKEKQK